MVPRARLLLPEGLDGFLPGDVAPYLARVRRFGEFRRRGDVEGDPSESPNNLTGVIPQGGLCPDCDQTPREWVQVHR